MSLFSKEKPHVACSVCGSTNIEVKCWMKWDEYTGWEYVEEVDPYEVYCESCDLINGGKYIGGDV